ncbi:MAG TPA: WXG100 family type VII secretion target [Jatrophihabitans sp.]|nr:WXG100 family type VII secretion target [Jatrophihabitans sp.]
MSSFEVTPVELDLAAATVRAATDHARACLAQLRTSVNEALAGWQGGAARAFDGGWQLWLDGTLEMLRALEELADAMGASGAGYGHAEQTVQTGLARGGQ